jgi:SAM-dependent methyltransferase
LIEHSWGVTEYIDPRVDMVPFVPASTGRLLDVGCSTGQFATTLREHGSQAELWGIDLDEPLPDWPQPFDTRLTGSFPEGIPEGERFDCVAFNDVLEHMVDPWAALRATRELLTPSGVVIASIPNVRYISVLRPLVLHGGWRYRDDGGVLAIEHLRFFTRSTIVAMFESTGYAIDRIEPIRVMESGEFAMLNRLTRGRLTDFLAERYAVAATASPTSP